MGQNKARCTIQFVDAAGKPIKGLNYWLKDERDYQIAKGETNSAGMSYELVQDVGAEVNVFVEKYRQNEWKKLKTFYLHDRFQIVRLESPKILLESTTVQHEGNTGEYQRKTHEVKKSETLSGIAQKYGTTVRALERLNQIENAGRLAIGQVLKLPIKTPAGTAGGGAVASQTQQPSSTTPRSTSSGDRSHNQTPSGSVMDRLGKMGDEVAQDVASGWNRLSQWGEEVSQEAKTGWERLSGAATSSTGVLDKAEQWYNARKAELEKAAKELFTIKIDRSANTTSPKDDVRSNCRTQPACIPKGTKSELIREINIRLAGFGGALPTDEFTDLTEKCIKQFQRDYMGVPETGKICGSLLVALDEFMAKYPMDKYFAQMKCKCGKCSGYGQGQMNVNWFGKRANEYPGIYRGLVWILRASQFYLDKAKLGYDILKISSGYRCIEDNKQHKDSQGNWPRKTINHMGLALDVQYVKKGETTRTGQAGIDTIRSKIFTEFIGAAFLRGTDKIYLESSAEGAGTWVHFDCTRFSIKNNSLFAQNIGIVNGESLASLAKKMQLNQLVVCGGAVASQIEDTKVKIFTENDARVSLRKIYDVYGKELAEIVECMYRAETAHFKSKQYQYCGTPGMESHGVAPYYGWDSTLFVEQPVGLWSAFEGKGLSTVGGTQQETSKKKDFVKVSSVDVGMEYLAKYINKYNGNYARWYSKNDSNQRIYREKINSIIPRIVRSFK